MRPGRSARSTGGRSPTATPTEHGLFFLAFSADLSTLVDMLERMYGVADGVRDRLTDISAAVSGSYYVALSNEALDAIVAGAGPA